MTGCNLLDEATCTRHRHTIAYGSRVTRVAYQLRRRENSRLASPQRHAHTQPHPQNSYAETAIRTVCLHARRRKGGNIIT